MKYMRRTAGYTWTDYKTNVQIAKELKITPYLDRLLEYKRSWIQHVNRMPRNRFPRVMKHYCPTGRRNHGRLLERLLDTWDRNGSTSGPTPWQVYDDDGDCACVGYNKQLKNSYLTLNSVSLNLQAEIYKVFAFLYCYCQPRCWLLQLIAGSPQAFLQGVGSNAVLLSYRASESSSVNPYSTNVEERVSS